MRIFKFKVILNIKTWHSFLDAEERVQALLNMDYKKHSVIKRGFD